MNRDWLSAACLAITVAFSAVQAVRFAGDHPGERPLSTYAATGEILAHGIRARSESVSFRMPLASLVSARLERHAPARYPVLVAAARVLLVALVFAAAGLLHPFGALSAASLCWPVRDLHLYPDVLYTLLVVLCAGLLVWRARKPTLGRTALLAGGLGVSLLWRSPLAFFGPALALYEWAFEKRPLKNHRAEYLALCLAPYLFLLPWIAMNADVHGRLVIFEHGAANTNIVAGALGVVHDLHGDLNALIGEPVDAAGTGSVLGWAARETARHPARFARAFVLRLGYALSFHPWLAVFALAGVWMFRVRREYRELALLSGYFLLVHCFMAVEERYFWPLRPLLALLAFAPFTGARPLPDESASLTRLSGRFLKGVLAVVSALALWTSATVLSFAFRAHPATAEAQLDAALRAAPDDAWLLGERGEERLARGDRAGAAADFARSAALDPEDPAAKLRAARLDPAALLALNDVSRPGPRNLRASSDLDILKACAAVRLGRKADAAAHLQSAWNKLKDQDIALGGASEASERPVRAALRAADDGFADRVRRAQGAAPDAEKLALSALLADLFPDSCPAWLDRAEREARAGERAKARTSLARAEKNGPNADDQIRIASLRGALGDRDGALAMLASLKPDDASGRERLALAYQQLKDFDAALALFDRLARENPAVAAYRADKGLCEELTGDHAAALADLNAAIALDPKFLPAYLTLGAAHEAAGRKQEAARVYAEALARSAPEDPLRARIPRAR